MQYIDGATAVDGATIQDVLDNKARWAVEVGHCVEGMRRVPSGSIHCAATSPPYYGLRDYGVDGQIGNEETPEEYIDTMVRVFREVRRILRPDGTLWLNLGDCYANDGKWGGETGGKQSYLDDSNRRRVGREKKRTGLKPKDLCFIPERVAMALQADGWFVRSKLPWLKRNSMPESVTDRPPSAVEYVFLLTRSADYSYDTEAVKVESNGHDSGNGFKRDARLTYTDANGARGNDEQWKSTGQRLRRNCDWFFESWQGLYEEDGDPLGFIINVNGYKGAHFATWPTLLVAPMLRAGTSEKGCCPKCGAPWRRIIEKDRVPTRPGNNSKVVARLGIHEESPYHDHGGVICGNRDPKRHTTVTETKGWEPGCKCGLEPIPCCVLDPFGGALTTILVSQQLGLRGIAFELNESYAQMGRARVTNRGGVAGLKPAPGQRELFA